MFERFIYMKLEVVGTVWDMGYRSHCQDVAKNLNATGYAVNLDMDRVEVVVECEPEVATEFLQRIKKSYVNYLEIKEVKLVRRRNHKAFEELPDRF